MRRLAFFAGLLSVSSLSAVALILVLGAFPAAGQGPLTPWIYLPLLVHQTQSPELEWDPRLTARGTVLIPAQPQPGQGYWRLVKGVWYAEDEPPFEGQHHIFVDARDVTGLRQPGVPIQVTSLDGLDVFATLITEAKPGELYAANFPMYVPAPAYRAIPADGNPADAVSGMGLGSLELPRWNIHTSYGFVWRWVIAPDVTPTLTPTETPTSTSTATLTATPILTPTVSVTPTPSATGTLTATLTPSPTATATTTLTPTATATPRATPWQWPQLAMTPYISGLSGPVHITHAGDGSGRLFVVEQAGRVRIIQDGVLRPTPFLDISGRVSCCNERGLFSIAFPPGYPARNHFYANYTDLAGNTVIARYGLTADPNVADSVSEQIVLTVAQPYTNHNGGQIAFGPDDGYLYIGMGDGGSGGDPENRAQNPGVLLGKLLRIDVETGNPLTYTVPLTNPFNGVPAYRPEIWALGLRNPWRFAFDRATGDLFVADVGQAQYEEVNFQPAASPGGENYGWRIMEGFHCYNPTSCRPANLTVPILEYDHSQGCSITGGVIYRGAQFARLQGIYLYGDYCNGQIWGVRQQHGAWRVSFLYDAPFNIATFGEDEAGESYTADYAGGVIHRIVDATHAQGISR